MSIAIIKNGEIEILSVINLSSIALYGYKRYEPQVESLGFKIISPSGDLKYSNQYKLDYKKGSGIINLGVISFTSDSAENILRASFKGYDFILTKINPPENDLNQKDNVPSQNNNMPDPKSIKKKKDPDNSNNNDIIPKTYGFRVGTRNLPIGTHACILVDNDIFEYGVVPEGENKKINKTYLRNRNVGQDPAYNWEFLGERLHGQTHVSPDELESEILKYKKWESGRYNLLFHNCHDFVKFCLEKLGCDKSMTQKIGPLLQPGKKRNVNRERSRENTENKNKDNRGGRGRRRRGGRAGRRGH